MLGRCLGRCVFLFISITSPSLAQVPESIETAESYALEVRELEKELTTVQNDIPKLSKEWTDTNQRIAQNMVTIQGLLNEQALGAMRRMQADMASFSTGMRIAQQLPRNAQEASQLPVANRQALTAQSQRLANIQVQADAISHELNTIAAAGNLAVQRHLSMLQELRKISDEFVSLQKKNDEILLRYWEWADVEGVRSDVELAAGLDQLRQAREENVGAALAKAITLVRLGEFSEATPLIDLLSKWEPTAPFAIALRAEVQARTDNQREALADLRRSSQLAKDDPRVRMHRAQAYWAADDKKQALREWDAVLKSGQHDIAAYRAISFLLSSPTRRSPADNRRATEYATLASQLAGDDWASELAVALAAAASGKQADAEAAVERARELALGDNQALCEELIEKIKRGEHVSWAP